MPSTSGLSVEFTPTQTIATIVRPDGGTEPLPLDGSPRLPVPVPGGAGDLLGRIRVAAAAALGEGPATVTLRHPDDWDAERVREIVDAARNAGLPHPTLLPLHTAIDLTPSPEPPSPVPHPPSVAGPKPVRAVHIVLAAVVALLVGLGVGGIVGYGIPSGAEPVGTEVDTKAALKAAEVGTEAYLSYDYRNFEEWQREAESHLTASFAKDYRKFMADLRGSVEEQKTVATCEVIMSGVGKVEDGNVEVLMFVDQLTKNEHIEGERRDHSRIVVTMTSGEDGWKIDEATAR